MTPDSNSFLGFPCPRCRAIINTCMNHRHAQSDNFQKKKSLALWRNRKQSLVDTYNRGVTLPCDTGHVEKQEQWLCFYMGIYRRNKRSVLRRQSRDTNRNYEKVGVLPSRIVKSNVSSVGLSSGPTTTKGQRSKLRLYYSYRQYTNLFIFRLYRRPRIGGNRTSFFCLPIWPLSQRVTWFANPLIQAQNGKLRFLHTAFYFVLHSWTKAIAGYWHNYYTK